MAFDIDVLIVFADRDNETHTDNSLGWVTQFKRFLELMLLQVLGEKPNIMLKSEHDNLTAPDMRNAAVLVTIVSKDFIASGQCLDHVEAFFKGLENHLENRSRVFKVFKAPLTITEQPPRLRELLGYEMYQLDPDSGEIKEYTDYFSNEAERQYWMSMVDLSYDIYDSLLFLKGKSIVADNKSIFKRKSIYLAETGHDLFVQRNIIKRELQRHGYTVLPNQTLPGNLNEIERTVRKAMEDCSMSIHLIGSAYGEIPEGTDKSVVDIQNRIAAEKSLETKGNKEFFSRLIWISPSIVLASEKQKAFIESIKRDVETQEGTEILQNPLEDFKNIMREELEEAGEKRISDNADGRAIYLMHDKVDHQAVKPIIECLEQAGYKVLMPTFEGELLVLRKKHIENLRNLDGAIIYKGVVNEQWARMKALDLLKAPGFGRKKPIIAKALVSPPGSLTSVDSFKNQNLRVIQSDVSGSIESIKSFLQEFKS